MWKPVFRCDCLLPRNLFQGEISFLVIQYSFINSASISRVFPLYRAPDCLSCRDMPDTGPAHEECTSAEEGMALLHTMVCHTRGMQRMSSVFQAERDPPGWRWTRPASWRMWWHVSSHSLFIFVAIQTPPKQPKNPTHEQWRDKLWDPPNGVLYSHYTVHRIGSNVEKTYIWTLSEREKNTKVYI